MNSFSLLLNSNAHQNTHCTFLQRLIPETNVENDSFLITDNENNKDDVPIVLYVYEFDAKGNLKHEDLEELLDTMSKVSNIEDKTFETVAGLCENFHVNVL